jgi:tetratricopeptide (TPR) repeat protein
VPTAVPYAFALAALLAQPAQGGALERLVAQLGSENWHEREAAAEEILRFGQHAAAALQRALKSPDPEVRYHARALLDQLRWRPPSGLPPFLAAALKYYPDLGDDRRATILTQVANAAGARAVPFLRKALRHDRSLSVRAAALARLERLDPGAAEAELRALAGNEQLRTWATVALADLLARANRIDDAIAAYEAARKAAPARSRVHSALAGLYERKGDWRKALPIYAFLSDAEPRNSHYRIRLGWCHHRLGERAKAESAWRQILRHRAHDPQAYLLLARTFQQAGARDKMLAILTEGCRKHKQDFELRRRLASALVQAGRTDEAVEVYDQAAALASTEYQRQSVSRELGRALRRSGRLAEYVEREEREIAKLDREIARLMHALAERSLAAGSHAKARRLLERLTELYPNSDEARRAAKTLRALGKAK